MLTLLILGGKLVNDNIDIFFVAIGWRIGSIMVEVLTYDVTKNKGFQRFFM